MHSQHQATERTQTEAAIASYLRAIASKPETPTEIRIVLTSQAQAIETGKYRERQP